MHRECNKSCQVDEELEDQLMAMGLTVNQCNSITKLIRRITS